nr:zinc finger protein GIS2-like [Ipomoea batatas]
MPDNRSRSRSPMDRKIRTQRYSYRDAPYSQNGLCKNCKRPGHFARECPNVAICHNCGLPGHIASECTTKSLCWNCREPGHMAGNCPNEGICHTCGKAGHHDSSGALMHGNALMRNRNESWELNCYLCLSFRQRKIPVEKYFQPKSRKSNSLFADLRNHNDERSTAHYY